MNRDQVGGDALARTPAATLPVDDDPESLLSRDLMAVKWYLAGYSIADIADHMRLPERLVTIMVTRQLGRMVEEDVTVLRKRELQYLHELRAALDSRILLGDPQAVLVALRVTERIAKMVGLDKPARLNIAVDRETRQIHTIEVRSPAIETTATPAIEGKGGAIDAEFRDSDPGDERLALRQGDEQLQHDDVPAAV